LLGVPGWWGVVGACGVAVQSVAGRECGAEERMSGVDSDTERLPPAINPEGAEVDHDCVFRRMVRDLAQMVGVQPAEGGLYRAEDIEDAITALVKRATPSGQ
jgi:hypothetical protein